MTATSCGQTPVRKRLGDLLQERGLVTGDQVEMALLEQRRTGKLLGEILLQLGFVIPQGLAAALAEQGGVPFLELAALAIPPEMPALVPEAVARRLKVLPLERRGQDLRLAMANIFDLEAIAEIEKRTRLRVSVASATEEDILAQTGLAYGGRKGMEEALEEAIRLAEAGRDGLESEMPIVRLVDQLLLKALRDRATDLHIQPSEHTVITRFRVDGLLVQGPSLPKALQPAVLARLKIMAEVDIAEARQPQDGKFRIPHGRRQYDIRASFLPALYGEKVVLRILDKSNLILGLDQLGMPAAVLNQFTAMLARPHGVILVTGPTGSGKTTTLYSAINRLNSVERCILTVEDPVEYKLPLITQVSLNLKAGLTFATGLRSILRQDPDIILVGEIRDPETAAITLRAAMTGHLVLSTLHTNDPVSAIPRLKEMGISPLELAAALAGIHAQRLVRLNCPGCARPWQPDPGVLALVPDQAEGPWMKGTGCEACAHTGIRGRRAIHDLLPVSPGIREGIAAGSPPWEIEALARREGKSSLREHALALARQGLISPDEAVRVTVVGT
jgi:type IV pilus assembly protein PilB